MSAPASESRAHPRTAGREPKRLARAELLAEAEETARRILEAEDALNAVRDRFERTDDHQERGELAVEALEHVERQLKLTRERRRLLDGLEGTLWARRNRLERFLISTRGSRWWHSRRNLARAQTTSRRAERQPG